jgi:hypothetical protein
MMTVTSIAFGVMTVLCIIGLCLGAYLERHLRRNHSDVWESLAFPPNTSLLGGIPPAEDARFARAQMRMAAFMNSKKRRNLNDRVLNTLWRVELVIFVCVALLIVAADLNPVQR